MLSTEVVPSSSEAAERLAHLFEWADSLQLAYAWAKAPEHIRDTIRPLPEEKIERAVVGISFGDTDAAFLERLYESSGDNLRVIELDDRSGLFHPKLAIGRSGTEVRALCGSSNLTASGFGSNIELNVYLQGQEDHEEIETLEAFVDELWSHPGTSQIDGDWLENYRDWGEEHERERNERPSPPSPGEKEKSLDDDVIKKEPVSFHYYGDENVSIDNSFDTWSDLLRNVYHFMETEHPDRFPDMVDADQFEGDRGKSYVADSPEPLNEEDEISDGIYAEQALNASQVTDVVAELLDFFGYEPDNAKVRVRDD